MKVNRVVYKTADELATSAARQILKLIQDAATHEKRLNIMLSGGSTPALLFRRLAEIASTGVDWTYVHLYLGDERCVPHDHPESNFGLTKNLLLDKVPILAQNIHPLYLQGDLLVELERNEKELTEVPSFDLVLLGLGDDGHTASIFPDNMKLFDSATYCASAVHPTTGQGRLTVTPRFLLEKAKSIVFMVTGANKAGIIAEIFSGSPESIKIFPTAMLQSKRSDIVWLLDESAASKV